MSDNAFATRPNGFSNLELATLGVWFVAAGRWREMGFTEEEAQSLVAQFFQCLKGSPKDALRASYLSLQNTFMAMRKDSFEAIQSAPPFSRSERRNAKALLRAWQEGEAAFANKWSQIFSAGWETNGAPEQPVRAIPASGESADSAIQILTDDPEDKVNGEYWYLYHRYGRGWQCEMQMATRPDADGHRYDILHIRFSDGQKKRLYFLL